MNEKHPNSHVVTIFRAGSTLSRAQGKDVEEMFSMAKKSIGSYYEKNSIRIGSGLSFEEEDILLPLVLDVPKEDREFRKKVSEFYQDIDTEVPFDLGVSLEIGLKDNNENPVSNRNRPIKIMEYLRYRHAIGHPFVAMSKELANGNSMKEFYVFDPKNVQAKNSKKNDEKDAAMQIYLEMKQNATKVDMMLTLLGIDPREFSDDGLRLEALRQQAEANSARFIEVKNEGDLEIRAWIKSMVNTSVLKVIGSKYTDAETKAIIGNSLEETIAFFKDEENSDQITLLKALLQEALKKPIVPKKKVTQLTPAQQARQ